MSVDSKIQWTDATFNCWRGCTKISPGCTHCYAESWGIRQPALFGEWGDKGHRVIASEAYWHQPFLWNKKARLAGKRHRVFCASLADVFEDRPELIEPRVRLWSTIRQTPNLDWQILTKRPENFARLLPDDWGDGYPNCWLGVSVENQKYADERIPILLSTPARVRFASYEPALGPVDFRRLPCTVALDSEGANYYDAIKGYSYWAHGCEYGISGPSLDWIIVGGESGHGARPFDAMWALSTIKQCQGSSCKVFIKQLGSRPIFNRIEFSGRLRDKKGGDMEEWSQDLRVREFPCPMEATP